MNTQQILMGVGLIILGVACAVLGQVYSLPYLRDAGPVLVGAGLGYVSGSAHATYKLKQKYGIHG